MRSKGGGGGRAARVVVPRATASSHIQSPPSSPSSPLFSLAGVQLNAAQGQLQRYYEGVSSNKALVLKLLSIIVAFIVFFAVFLA